MQEKSISFYKLASNNVTTGNYSCAAGDQMSFDSVAFDPQSPNVFLVVSKASNTVEIYEARGRGLKFKCKNQGRLQVPENLKVSGVRLSSSTELAYLTFERSNKVAILPYDARTMVKQLAGKRIRQGDLVELVG